MTATKPNVLFLVFDTLRADYVSTMPDAVDRAETPTLDAFAEEGTLFEQAYSVGPNTEISHGAMFTGQYPSETGLVGGSTTIPDELTLLAEWFREQGYQTFGISGPAKLRSELGFDRGFGRYVEPYREPIEPEPSLEYLKSAATDSLVRKDFLTALRRGTDSVTRLKFDLLQKRIKQTAEPFFCFANFFTCHAAYDPPRPYKEESTPSLSRPRWFFLEWVNRLLGRESVSINRDDVRADRVLKAAGGAGWEYYGDSNWLTDAELEIVNRWYNASAKYLDDQLDRFLTSLREQGALDETIVVMTSDHGEYLGSHGMLYHGDFLHDEVLHVPLILAGPGVPEGERRSELVSLVDLFPTLCELTGNDPPAFTSGVSLFDATRDAVFAEYGISNHDKIGHHQEFLSDEERSAYACGRKLVRTETAKLVVSSDGDEELSVFQETAERDREQLVARLSERIAETLAEEFDYKHDTSDDVDAGVEANLRELGYMT